MNNKIIIIGLGSMGRRRIRLLKAFFNTINIYGVDSNIERCKEIYSLHGIETFSNVHEAIQKITPEIAFICTSPLSHYTIIKECLTSNLNIFTEINLVADGYDELIALSQKKNRILFLSSTPMYRHEIEHITNLIHESPKVVNYVYHVGQYLPDWHPWEKFEDFFVSNLRTNGCREIFAVELPWMVNAFGRISEINVLKDKNSELNILYPDNYLVSIKHENGNKGIFAVDVIARKPVRKLEIYSELLHVFWDGTPNSLFAYNILSKENEQILLYDEIQKDSRYSENIIENAYVDEIRTFFECFENCTATKHTFEKDKEILQWIDRIEN